MRTRDPQSPRFAHWKAIRRCAPLNVRRSSEFQLDFVGTSKSGKIFTRPAGNDGVRAGRKGDLTARFGRPCYGSCYFHGSARCPPSPAAVSPGVAAAHMSGQDGSYGARLPIITIDIVRMTARTKRDGLPGGNSGGLCHQTPRTAACLPFCGFRFASKSARKPLLGAAFSGRSGEIRTRDPQSPRLVR